MKKLVNLIKNNIILIGAVLVAIFVELLAITYTNCIPILTNPLYTLIILLFFIAVILIIPNKTIQFVVSSVVLITQLILDTIFIFLYDSNGTVFEWAMFNQRTDAFGTLETLELQYGYIIICAIIILIYMLGIIIYLHKTRHFKLVKAKKKNIILESLILGSLILILLVPTIETSINNKKGYSSKLYSTTASNYQTMGIISNAIYQVIRGDNKVKLTATSKITDFVYKEKIETSDYFGISKDNNLILILVESFEWYPLTLYPEVSAELYPNLTKLLNEGIIGSNFYQKEKTDVSEALAILGNYPTGRYINYDFADNSYPYSLPNILKSNNKNITVNAFHANYGDFYNRYNLYKSWGFDKLYAIAEMEEYGVADTWLHKKGERNLDSITFDKMKEVMFPTNQQFFSSILTFSMHGYYGERNNLNEYYQTLYNYQLFNEEEKDINKIYLKTYMAALMDFDKAVGIMLDYLNEKNLLDTTTIILYSDHNTYYNKLSNYAKNIDEKYNSELFHIPLIIYDTKVSKLYKEKYNTNKIDKFTTTADIVPTVLDLYGLTGWKNLYFGNSMFIPNTESIIYSRNYGIFITDKFVGYSLKNPIYEASNITENDLNSFEKRAITHLNKLEYIDKIYYSNYFKENSYQNK